MTDTHTDATALEALAVRVEGGETGREIEGACWFALHPEFRKWGGPSMYVPKGDPDYYGRTDWTTCTAAAEWPADQVRTQAASGQEIADQGRQGED